MNERHTASVHAFFALNEEAEAVHSVGCRRQRQPATSNRPTARLPDSQRRRGNRAQKERSLKGDVARVYAERAESLAVTRRKKGHAFQLSSLPWLNGPVMFRRTMDDSLRSNLRRGQVKTFRRCRSAAAAAPGFVFALLWLGGFGRLPRIDGDMDGGRTRFIRSFNERHLVLCYRLIINLKNRSS